MIYCIEDDSAIRDLMVYTLQASGFHAQGAALSGEEYFKNLNTENYRITWVSPNGKVLFDNEADAATMENHLSGRRLRKGLENPRDPAQFQKI